MNISCPNSNMLHLIFQNANLEPLVQDVNTTVADIVMMTYHATEQMVFVMRDVSLDTQEKNVTQVQLLYIVQNTTFNLRAVDIQI